jgi:hypothetical protein
LRPLRLTVKSQSFFIHFRTFNLDQKYIKNVDTYKNSKKNTRFTESDNNPTARWIQRSYFLYRFFFTKGLRITNIEWISEVLRYEKRF